MILNNSSIYHKLFCIFIFAFISRLIFTYFFWNLNYPLIEDEKSYYRIAAIYFNDGFFNSTISYRVPLNSLIIIPLIKFFSQEEIVFFIRLLMITISSISCILFFLNCKELKINEKNSILITIFYSLYPFSLFLSSRYLSENLAVLLLLCISLSYIKYNNLKNYKFLLLTSFFLALVTLTRSAFYYLIFILIFLIFIEKNNFKLKFFKIILMLSVFYITLSPWIIKNYIHHNEFIPTTSRLGYGLWLSNNDFSDNIIKRGGYNRTINYQKHIDISNNIENVTDRSNYLITKSLENIYEIKFNYLKILFKRFINTFHFKPNPYQDYKKNDYMMLVYILPVYIFFLKGIFTIRLNYNISFFLLSILYVTLIHLPFYGFPRFRYPVDSFIIILSGRAFFIFLNKIKKN